MKIRSRLIGIQEIMRRLQVNYAVAVQITKRKNFPKQKFYPPHWSGWDEDEFQEWFADELERRAV